jgi:hypothetical protein
MDAPNSDQPLVARVPREHFKRWRLLQDWKWLLTAAVTLLVLAWWLSRFYVADRHAQSHSPGPLTGVHATWDNHCEACHDSFVPVNSPYRVLLHAGHAGLEKGSGKCKDCHAGPPHNSVTKASGEEANCGSCHRDHRGRDNSLTPFADADCLRCHRNLADRPQTKPDGYQNVTGFVGDQHPQFRLFATAEGLTDPGQLKFNHALHMKPGLVVTDGRNPWRLSNLDIEDRHLYRREGQADDAPVRLDCASCHRLDSGDVQGQSSGTPARSSGAYMLPISYDIHCKACHPLAFDDTRARAPHRLQPADLHAFLEGVYLDRSFATGPHLAVGGAAGPVGALPFPAPAPVGKPSRVRPDHPADLVAARNLVFDDVARAERRLYRSGQACDKCHAYSKDDETQAGPKTIVPTALPGVWFTRAKFNHVAHRAVDCKQCHARAYPDAADASRVHTDVLIAVGPEGNSVGLALCQRCHAPAAADHGGARFNCTECHTYHNGGAEHRLQGLGARARDPEAKDQ